MCLSGCCATHELTKGNVTAYQLAEHMGTSIGMLQTDLGNLDFLNMAEKRAVKGSVSSAILDNTTNKY